MPSPVLKLIFLMLLVCGTAAINICAATLTVTKTEDTNDGVCDADCSLREAVAAAVPGDTVVFSTLFESPQTITLTLGQITIDKNLSITGTGPGLVDVTANLAGRVFNISGKVDVNISGMKLRDGRVGVDVNDARGGAILFLNTALNGGTLNLTNMELTNNKAYYQPNNFGFGAAVYCLGPTIMLVNVNVHHNNFEGGAAIQADFATINIQDSVIADNRLGVSSADTINIQNTTIAGNAGGIGAGNLTLIDSEVSDNFGRGVSAGSGPTTSVIIENSIISSNTDAGLDGNGVTTIRNTVISNNQYVGGSGAGIVNLGLMYVIDSAIIGNEASVHGGGIATYGSLFLTNSTVSENIAHGVMSTAGLGGGIYAQVNTASHGRLTLTNSTISNNQSKGGGGGVRQDSGEMAIIRNTIIAGNTSTNTNEEDVSGAFTSKGTNLIGNTTGSSGWVANDLLNVNPLLGPLGDNGGGTMTHALLPGSPAINAGNNATAIDPQTQMPLTVDQRGFLRLFGGTVDIGAYESQPEITGTVIYGNATGSPTPSFVSGVLLSAVGSPNVFATTSAFGSYTLGGFGSGAYTVTPSKTGGANGISSFDAGLIAKHVAGIQVLTGNQLIVADVSGNGTLSSFDSGQIARYTAGLNGFGSSANWVFVPANRTYSSVNSTISGEDFIALLMGDVSGNWMPPGSRPSAHGPTMKECEGPTGNKIVSTAAVCTAFAEARASIAAANVSRSKTDPSRNIPASAGGLTSANQYPIMARKNDTRLPSVGNAANSHREIDRLIGESLEAYANRRSVEDMARAKARARYEEALRKCLPKEGELPTWANDWLANNWQDGKSVPANDSQRPNWIDPADPKVMWKWDRRGWLSKSMDGGANWDRLMYTYQNQWQYVTSLAVASENDKTVLLAGVMSENGFSFDSGIMRSDDGGETWYRVCDGIAALSVAFDPENPQNAVAEIIAPTLDLEVSRVVYSIDGGKHWRTATRNGVAIETDSGSRMRTLASLRKTDRSSSHQR